MAQTGDTSQMSVDTTDVFTTNKKIYTREAVVTWAQDVGIVNKVSIIIRSDKKNGKRGRNDKLILGCDKGGQYDSSESSTTTTSKKCHPRKARLTADENKCVEDLTKRHVAPRHIVLSSKEQNPESLTDVTQIYRKRSMLQKEERCSRTEMQQLLQLLDDAKYVSWNRRKDDNSDVLSDIFWAHPDSFKLLNLFPIVLVMDNMYKIS
ncbi:uncharacterized protein LOC123904996 [Trifolium pratense]|uniref:uncharacterized protein LOC123904996 n=1 Tax=Trifolium pratense TaxID=57577 RepID=UPI001E692446|nr:uncharacterized protein LOC123904996 [Trifolium pratense]